MARYRGEGEIVKVAGHFAASCCRERHGEKRIYVTPSLPDAGLRRTVSEGLESGEEGAWSLVVETSGKRYPDFAGQADSENRQAAASAG